LYLQILAAIVESPSRPKPSSRDLEAIDLLVSRPLFQRESSRLGLLPKGGLAAGGHWC